MEKPVFKPKIRTQLLTEDGLILTDRLVDQYIEFLNGPKDKHQGPVRLEIVLTNQADVASFKTYLDKLVGDLPVKQLQTRGRPASATEELNSPREDILNDVQKMVEQGSNQDEVIKYLRELGFVFLLTEDFLWYFNTFEFKSRDIGPVNDNGQYPAGMSWMVRRLKKSKDPKTDKYDPQIIFGFQIMNGRAEKVAVYLYKERAKPLKIPVPKKNALSFNNTEMTKFPKYMLEEERLKFSTEMRQLLMNDSKKPSKFFHRWYPDVIFPAPLQEKMDNIRGRN
jgi:hypothetical protein